VSMATYLPKEVPANHLSALFASLDADKSGAIELSELRSSLAGSAAKQPDIAPLTTKEHNTVMLRKPTPPKGAKKNALGTKLVPTAIKSTSPKGPSPPKGRR